MWIRTEQAADHAGVRVVHERAFGDDGVHVADLTDALRAAYLPDEGLSLVAGDDTGIIGHVLFTRSLLDAPERLVEVRVLSPLGVLPERQRQGVGAALVRAGLESLEQQGVPLVFLEGHPTYYPRLGFVPGGPLGFRKPSLRIPDPAFMVYRLPAYQESMTGTLVYSPIFWEFDAVGLRG
jgi:putative acetyltransferase